MCLVRSSIAKLCPNMIHFDALDFSECRSEEVMFLLMLSVLTLTSGKKTCHAKWSECDLLLEGNKSKVWVVFVRFDRKIHRQV